MEKETWYKYFKEDPNEKIGRYISGVFDEKVLVVLPRVFWAYIDWMEVEHKADFTSFFKQCESVPLEEDERHEVYRNTVYKNFLQFEKAGLSRPEWCTPASQEDFENFEDMFSMKIDEKDVVRKR
ncbi:hypothetical protein [Roseobacter sp.]|uniref:hypothetical protein n=1 Tax=Roseobacter sp. TaxID=1907202 RepID=UPI0029674441|nr:hypothetical protein [Roseobacter sp.]MDW3181647.1 hypothetical protein [Roseobacter sp.]